MTRANKFAVSNTWTLMLNDMGIDASAALAHAGLPADLLQRRDTALSPRDYFRLWQGIECAAAPREVALLLAENFKAEFFDAPIFASLCSPNLNSAARRLRHYKPLIGPMLLEVDETRRHTRLTLSCYGTDEALPRTLGLFEMVFFCQLARMGTRTRITPLTVLLPQLPAQLGPYEAYFGCSLRKADRTEIRFSADDAARSFMTSNATMWSFFEGKLNQRLAELDADTRTAERVRAVLLEALPAGQASIEAVAERLVMTKRTLQRKLADEGENFQLILTTTRERLADHYLRESRLSLGEISFLLGYQEPNSFIRAYRVWKGLSPGAFRAQMH